MPRHEGLREKARDRDESSATEVTSSPGNNDLDKARQLLDVADKAINQAMSADSEAFLRANRQSGGQ